MNARVAKLALDARAIRQSIIRTASAAPVDGVHLGPALSMVEIAAALYGAVMRFDPKIWPRWRATVFCSAKAMRRWRSTPRCIITAC
ncbi:hypothetical protein QMW83_04800 [Cronobacter sakazakii]|nr:hypothetical protein [Cronobacter sakazakii]